MQKKIIALAVAGLVSGAAFAQSNVTIYGVADVCVGSFKVSGPSGVGSLDRDFLVNSGCLAGSRIGFKGEEDLGNGMKAVWVMEQGVNMDTGNDDGNATFGGRQAYAGLSTKFGDFTFGRQYAPGYFTAGYDPLASSVVASPMNVLSNALGSGVGMITPNSDARMNNSMAYTLNMNGFTVRAIYGTADIIDTTGVEITGMNGQALTNANGAVGGTWNRQDSNDKAFGLGLQYANGPMDVGFFYNKRKDDSSAVTNAHLNVNEWFVGGSYNFGIATIKASYQKLTENREAGSATREIDGKLWTLGAVVPVGPGNVLFAYGKGTEDSNVAADNNPDSRIWTLAYGLPMSKRTLVHFGYTDRKDGSRNDSYQFGSIGTGVGTSLKGYWAGLNHTF